MAHIELPIPNFYPNCFFIPSWIRLFIKSCSWAVMWSETKTIILLPWLCDPMKLTFWNVLLWTPWRTLSAVSGLLDLAYRGNVLHYHMHTNKVFTSWYTWFNINRGKTKGISSGLNTTQAVMGVISKHHLRMFLETELKLSDNISPPDNISPHFTFDRR